MKRHLKHLAMCAPMVAVAALLLLRGVDVGVALLPLAGCVVMMWLMMAMMRHGHRPSGGKPAP